MTRFRGEGFESSSYTEMIERVEVMGQRPARRLKTILDETTASSYRYARRKAAIETDLGEEAFPAQCPWSFAEAVDAGFWPE